ncbi:MAG TPA: cysteine desulfurase NifS [Methanomassiliicoccaceae archaeon]|jgi:cysteine desulfurase|nr:cysteine desulfurase NifS [Euryarchaeota archaeon]HOB38032.1 cysteine desulfurase NifS [Methanomassiliicoccaceae archaeon]HPP44322.1 cysteine desulfurase NifS [Methanomassiliicoccaceae archaeon]HPT73314.1 cysteine desulfurase NifS [Methanomassiliicoccaceae archaeon]HQA20792.1 cysteine desulfurase NifS [Methanomassiliicoccaceae archaeon]
MDRVYFDNSATTRVDDRVLDAMRPYFLEKYGNASSLHSFGHEAYDAMEAAREQVAKAVNAAPRDIIFTSGGTESDNLALQGAAFANASKGKHIITSSVEHHAVLHTCQFLEAQGFKVTYLPVDSEGFVSEEDLKNALTPETTLVSIMMANNEIGTIQRIKDLAEIAKDKGALFMTDAVQALTKIPVDVERLNVDLLTMSAHKFHGPKGVGALYVRKGVKLRPIIYGGGHERGLRSSTENIPGIVGMGKAAELGIAEMDESVERMERIRDHLIDGTLSAVPRSYLNGPRGDGRLCNNANFRFDYIEGEGMVLLLDMQGIAASTGSACSTKSLEPSHVLRSLGLRHEQCHGSLRLSLSKFNTMEEADRFLEAIPPIIERLRKMSPLGEGVSYDVPAVQ